jgi:hypothetical protein
MTETRITLLGTVDTSESGEAVVLNIPLDADVATIKAAIAAAEEKKAADRALESRRLRELFLEDEPQ